MLEVSGTTIQGQPIDWSRYRGKVVLVDYWATFCGPCIAEMRNIKRHYQQYQDKGFEVVGVSLDQSRDAAADFVDQRNIPWPVIVGDRPEEAGWQHPMAVRYGVTSLPFAVLVDREGKVVNVNARGETLGTLLEEMLGTPVAKQDANTAKGREMVASQP